MKIHNLLINLTVYIVGGWLLMKVIDFGLEFALITNINDKFSFYAGFIITGIVFVITLGRNYELVPADTIVINHYPLGNTSERTDFICHFTGFSFRNIFEIYTDTISLKNAIGVVKDFKISTKDTHVFLEMQYDYEPDPEEIETFFRNATTNGDIIEDINSKIDILLKAAAERMLSTEKSVKLVVSATNTFQTLKDEIEKVFDWRDKEARKLGIKPPIVRFGNIDLSEEESKSRVTIVKIRQYRTLATNLATRDGIDFNQALAKIMANDGIGDVSDKTLRISGSAENITIVAPGGTI